METSHTPLASQMSSTQSEAIALDVNPFFLFRRSSHNFAIDAKGFWSYPALLLAPDKSLCWLHIILPAVSMLEKKRTALFRPKAFVVTRANSTVLIRYENFRLGHDPFPTVAWNTPIAMFPHKAVWPLSYDAFEEAEKRLLSAYDEAHESFKSSGELPRSFRQQYLALIHPIFLPYLRNLAPEFVTALATADASSITSK